MWTRKNGVLLALTAAVGAACTKGVPSQIQLSRTDDVASAGSATIRNVDTTRAVPIDILWVIDNSDSMKPSQDKLRAGLKGFANKFLTKDGLDLRMGVITTDAFVANSDFSKYLATDFSGSGENGKPAKKNPVEWHSFLMKKQSETLSRPQFGPDYAKLSDSDILSTKDGSISSLVSRFESQVTVGITGIYEERGFGSVTEFVKDNEKSGASNAHPLFRKGSQRIIVFVSDEDDQTLAKEDSEPKLLYKGAYYIGRGAGTPAQKQVQSDNINPAHFTINCEKSVVDGVELAPMTICLRPNLTQAVAEFKSDLDGFFTTLDGASGSANYMIVSIVSKDLKTIQTLRAKTPKEITHEQGKRYLDLVSAVGNGSIAMDIGAENYAPILEKIGLEIQNRSVVKEFAASTKATLDRAPNLKEEVYVSIKSGNGAPRSLAPSAYKLVGNTIEITDPAEIARLKEGDKILVNSRPSRVSKANAT